MNPVMLYMFICPECGRMHSREEYAQECCEPEVRRETMWKCGSCHKTWNTEERAEACCKEK